MTRIFESQELLHIDSNHLEKRILAKNSTSISQVLSWHCWHVTCKQFELVSLNGSLHGKLQWLPWLTCANGPPPIGDRSWPRWSWSIGGWDTVLRMYILPTRQLLNETWRNYPETPNMRLDARFAIYGFKMLVFWIMRCGSRCCDPFRTLVSSIFPCGTSSSIRCFG